MTIEVSHAVETPDSTYIILRKIFTASEKLDPHFLLARSFQEFRAGEKMKEQTQFVATYFFFS